MKKDLVSASLAELKQEAPGAAPTEKNEGVLITAADVAAYKRYFGAKWDKYAKRGNPYGEIKGIRGEYRRATYIVYLKQLKALTDFAEAEGLTLKEGLEIALEIGLKALTGKSSEEAQLTPEDVAPKFTRKQ